MEPSRLPANDLSDDDDGALLPGHRRHDDDFGDNSDCESVGKDVVQVLYT